MKFIIRILLLSFVLLSMTCEDDTALNVITQEQLDTKKHGILSYIADYSCTDATGCNFIAFGAKPCGGPREYLVYPNTVNQITIENMVNDYYKMDNNFNIQTGAVSDCIVVSPPNNIDCVDGNCIIID